MLQKLLKPLGIALAVVFVGAQLYRPEKTNPPVDPQKTLSASMNVPPDIDAILTRSCKDCHSNETVWPWYGQVAPFSWWLVEDVEKGRKDMNLSEWVTFSDRKKARRLKQICEQVETGEMPIPPYLFMHTSARLTDADKHRLCEWTRSLSQP
jgi:hypothetical protein